MRKGREVKEAERRTTTTTTMAIARVFLLDI